MLPNTVNAKGPRPAKLILCAALALALSACGGGGGNPGAVGGGATPTTPATPGGTPTAPAAPTVTVAFADANNQITNTISAGAPITARATLKDAAGKPIPEALVTFTTDNTLALFSPSTGTSLTDENGVASIGMRSASLSAGGAAKLSATTTVAGATVTGERNYSVGATALTLSAIALDSARIEAYGSTNVSVDVLANGTKLTSQQLIVNFTSACVTAGKASLAASAPTKDGTAKVVYRDLGCATRDTISATIDGAGAAVSQPLDIMPPAAASVQFAEAAPTSQSIVIKGEGGILRTETATLKFRVFDTFNRPLPGQLVTFALMPANMGLTLNKKNDTTDQNGEVITTVNSGSTATTFRVTAKLENGVSTISDSIVVTTGLPVQRAFSLSVVKPNIEGQVESTPNSPATQVNVIVADEFGNPVADGTPVVFQTNMGAIGSSSKGGCNLINGGCSVDFRSQEPRVATPYSPVTPCNTGHPGSSQDSTRPGVATVCASTTDGTNTVFSKIHIYFSGMAAAQVYLNGTTRISQGVATDLGSVKAGEAKEFVLQIADVNGNPLPSGTSVEVTGPTNASVAEVTPNTVQNMFPVFGPGGVDLPGVQGSSHYFKVKGEAATPCVPGTVASFNVSITSPILKFITAYPFKMTLTCP